MDSSKKILNPVAKTSDSGPRKPYVAPRILSTEPLEAVAAVCDGTGGYGKSRPTCAPGQLGS